MVLALKKAAKARRPLESSFEEGFCELLRARGVESWHVTARDPGWPDRFCATGDWIEFKVIESLANDGLEPEQHGRMRQLAIAGVRVWYVAWFDGGTIVCRYPFDVPLTEMVEFVWPNRDSAILAAYRQGGFPGLVP
jgi:hypothetical protein